MRKLFIKEVCKEHKLTMSKVAECSGMSVQALSNISTGRDTVSIDKLETIAKAIAELSDQDANEIFCKIIGCI